MRKQPTLCRRSLCWLWLEFIIIIYLCLNSIWSLAEGAGCIASPCMDRKCPQEFSECTYVQQKSDYLCCKRALRESIINYTMANESVTAYIFHWLSKIINIFVTENVIQCPNARSFPQMDSRTHEVVTCIEHGNRKCSVGFSCQFSSYGHGTYICCSNTPSPNVYQSENMPNQLNW